ncbi:MAG: asparagine synthase (glutamine-hydrolyzing) [Bacteroidales bacterium]|nr:asparagine synthase (glutamine-hydrolyzing) [Bacteroidales bacterium]
MCGITGFYTLTNQFVSRDELDKMTLALKHRGPDASGMYYTPGIGLGHRRLSIIDLSSDANQPMESHSMRYICVYNGEVYNFKTIARELNIDFKTSCDTEVIIEAFAEWGVTFVNKLNGMFAIAIFDKQEHKLYLFRDRIGVKPIYYYWDGKNFAFASELKSLLQIRHIRDQRQIDQQSICDYLHLGYIPEPNSIYKNVYKFPAGNFGIVSSTGLRIESYWLIEGAIRRKLIDDEQECKEKLKELIESSVSMRLISDVPFGTFLSGGVDSSLVTAVASKYVTKPLNTFSIGFFETKYNESSYARRVAEHLNTNHHEMILTELDAQHMMVDMLNYYDEPFADSSAIPTMLVSKFARDHVTMVLSGDGGDELFHGYGAYKWARRLSFVPSRTMRRMVGFLLANSGQNRYRRAAHLFQYQERKHLKSHIFSQEQYLFSLSEVNKLMLNNVYIDTTVDQDYSYFVRKLTPEEDQAVFDLKYYLKDDLLVKVDRASMKYGLETRVPLLDYRIIEFALNISPKLKIQGGIQKYLLKEVLYDYLPREFFDRPKWGFSIPLSTWLNRDMSYLIDDHLNEWMIRKHKIVNFEETSRLIKSFRDGTDYLYNRIWLLIILHRFMENDKNLQIL